MGATKDFRPQSSTPSNPSPSTVQVYANSDNILLARTSGNAPVQIGSDFTGVVPQTSVTTGLASYLLTGTVFGSDQGALLGTGLATPSIWLSVSYNGSNYAVPAYAVI